MSLQQRMKQGFLRLPFVKKSVLVASFLAMVSTLMPWYDQRNSVGIGDTYLGLQGPLFIIGAMVLLFSGITFLNVFLPLLGRNFFNLRRKSGVISLIFGAESLLFLAVSNIIFYSPEFGITSSSKSTRFGMMVAFASVGVMIVAGYFAKKREKNESDDTIEFGVNQDATASIQSEVKDERINIDTDINRPAYQNVQNSPSQGVPVQTSLTDNVDPLTLDAKTRYKMMQSQMRYSSSARGNLWGSGRGSAFSSPSTVSQEFDREPTDY